MITPDALYLHVAGRAMFGWAMCPLPAGGVYPAPLL